MSVNPVSFRLPFALPDEVHPGVRDALRLTYQSCVDLNQAISALNKKVNANTQAVTTVASSPAVASGGGSASPTFGFVNLQPNLTPGAYTLLQSDLGGLVLVNSGVAFALTLNSGLTLPFFTSVYNFGAATITATPSVGTVNNLASLTLVTGQFATFFMDSSLNWWALVSTSTNGLSVYANNAAALAGGLVAGDIYRTGADPDLIAVVH